MGTGDGHGAGRRRRGAGRRPADRPVALHTPSEVKAAISGTGRADKDQVTLMVTRVLGLAGRARSRPTPPTRSRWPICHVWRGPAQDRLRVAALAGARIGRAR